jgi:3-phosphoshikimate 1-carboxyvinyltransferase
VATDLEIRPVRHPLDAVVTPPGSKSITNRILLVAAMAPGESQIANALLSDDTRFMIDALRRLGFTIDVTESPPSIRVLGNADGIPVHGADLFVGGAGTAMRFLAAFTTLGHGRFRIDGNERMRQRPAGPLLDTLCALGARAISERANGCPPLVIERGPEPFAGGEVTVDASISSQFASALLMPAPLWRRGIRLHVAGDTARPFIDMTIRLMESRGVRTSRDGDTIVVPGEQLYRPGPFQVEPDASGASYFAAAAALCGGRVTIRGLRRDSVQGDAKFLDLLERMGARLRWVNDGVEVTGNGALSGIDTTMNAMPDMVPTLAAIAAFARSRTRIRGVAFIRHHESDRLAALATELNRIGAGVVEHDDGLTIEPSSRAIHPAAIETYDDHRIAMAFAITGLKIGGIQIKNPACVAKTYPNFFADLARACQSEDDRRLAATGRG